MADISQKPAPDFVRLVLDKDRRYKLRFRHKEIRNAVLTSGKAIGDLVMDPFGGWPYLLAEGHRPYNAQVTLDNTSAWIDEWVRTPDPQTNESRDMVGLQKLLTDALTASGFLKIKSAESNDDDDERPEGNGQTEADD